jgi:fluoride exporter
MSGLFLVMIGGALGAGLRYGVSLALPPLEGAFPWATFFVNLAGGLGAGLLLAFLGSHGPQAESARLLLGVGLLGGFTTFSAFSAETAGMIQNGQFGLGLVYMLASVLGALGLLFAGLWLGRAAA